MKPLIAAAPPSHTDFILTLPLPFDTHDFPILHPITVPMSCYPPTEDTHRPPHLLPLREKVSFPALLFCCHANLLAFVPLPPGPQVENMFAS